MRHLSVGLLLALFSFFPLGLSFAEDEMGKGNHRSGTSAGLSERSRTGELKVTITPAEEERARWQRDVVMPKLGEILQLKELNGYLGALGPLKQTLTQIPVGQEKEAPKPSPQRQVERVELSLQKSVEIALKNNLGVRITELSKEALAQEVSRAKAKFHPTVGLTVGGSYEKSFPDPDEGKIPEANSQSVTAFIRQEVPTGAALTLSTDLARSRTRSSISTTEFGSGLTLSFVQPLFRGGRVYVATRPIRDAEFDLRASEARLKAEVFQVTAAAKSAYYNMVLAEKVIEATEAAIQRDRTLIEASQALFKAGFVTKLDVFSAELILAQDSARLVAAQADLEAAKNVLLDILGLPIVTEVALLEKMMTFQPVSLELERWIATALKNRPEIQELQQQLAKSSLNIRNARNSVLPQVDLVATYGRSEIGPNVERALDLVGQKWTVGLVFSVPIGNVAAKSALSRVEIEHVRLQEVLRQRQRQIELEVRAAVIKLRQSVGGMKAFQAALEQAKGKLEVARVRFALGQATNLDITDAQKDLLEAETELLRAEINYNIGIAELEARIAGTI